MIKKTKQQNPWTDEFPVHGREVISPVPEQFDASLRVAYLINYKLEAWGPLIQKAGDLCFDLRAAIAIPLWIYPERLVKIPLGVKFDLPPNIGITIVPRSSLCKSGLFLANHSGRIDPSYRGEVIAPVFNFSDMPVIVEPGQRIVQGEITFLKRVSFETIHDYELSETDRGINGFGSTGKV